LNNLKLSKYNDGVVRIYREKRKENSFEAKENVSVLDDLEFIAKLDYEESSKREQDLEFANQNNFSLTMKVRTRFLPTMDKKNRYKAVIDGYLYDVQYADITRTEIWWYLEGIKAVSA
jgi:hypothetical protein